MSSTSAVALPRSTAVAGEPAFAGPLMIGSDIYRSTNHRSGHPLAIPRVSLCIDLCRALGWLTAANYLDSPRASVAELCRFHDPDYVAAVERCERRQDAGAEDRVRFNLGVNGNPVYPAMFARPATACGASLAAARLLRDGGREGGRDGGIVHSPAGGTHHGLAGRASGFCTFNDPVLAILALLDGGLERVFYLDLDAHFGDGVQMAFADDARVFTLSVHEAGRWPMGRDDTWSDAPGGAYDRAGGAARNVPVPRGFNDTELEAVLAGAIMPLIDTFAPEALVIQCGADALADDPMTKLALSNGALWRAVGALRRAAPRLLVLGGGGYNPWSVARCWAGVWATLNGFAVPERLPDGAEQLLRSVRWNHRQARSPKSHWFTTLADARHDGPLRPEVRALIEIVTR